jgi:glycosyltransferase involved in cell wall biosynthesis
VNIFFLSLRKHLKLVYADIPLSAGTLARIAKSVLGAKFIQFLGGNFYKELHASKILFSKLLNTFFLRLCESSLSAADYVVTEGADLRILLIRRGFPSDKIGVIPSGVDIALFKPSEDEGQIFRQSLGLSRKDRVVVFAGRFSPENGPQQLINCIPKILLQVPETKFVFAGWGPLEKELKDAAISYPRNIRNNIIFLGPVSPQDMSMLYNAADVCVFPIIFCGGISQVVLEAMACGKTVITSYAGNNPNLIRDLENGVLVDPLCVDELVDRIVLCLKNPELVSRIGSNARKTIEQFYDWEKIVTQYTKLFEELLRIE